MSEEQTGPYTAEPPLPDESPRACYRVWYGEQVIESLLHHEDAARLAAQLNAAHRHGFAQADADLAALSKRVGELPDCVAVPIERLKAWRQALADCYDVNEWPANGESEQDRAMHDIDAALKHTTTESAARQALEGGKHDS